MELVKLLETLTAAFGPSGCEDKVAEVIEDLARPYVDEISRDIMGNLICHKRGNGARVLLAAHMDSIGLMVTHIEKSGLLRVGRIGSVSPVSALFAPVVFQSGARGVIAAQVGVEPGKLKIDDLFVDIGASSESEAGAQVQVGDPAVFDGHLRETESMLLGPYLDNRAGCAALLLAMEELKQCHNDLYFVFTVQEEVGTRGAVTAAYAIYPDYALSVDVMAADDLPGSKHDATTRLGSGAGIKVMDASVICHPAVVGKLKALAKERDIPVQGDVTRRGGTDAGAIHKSRRGVYTGGVSIPCRYTHTPNEMVCKGDVLASADLIRSFAESSLELG